MALTEEMKTTLPEPRAGHRLDQRIGEQHHPGQIEVEFVLDLVGGQRGKRLGARPAGIVDQDVGHAVFVEDRSDRGLDRGPVEQVEDMARGKVRAGQLASLDWSQPMTRAPRSGQQRHDGRAEAAAGAGDHDSLAFEFGFRNHRCASSLGSDR